MQIEQRNPVGFDHWTPGTRIFTIWNMVAHHRNALRAAASARCAYLNVISYREMKFVSL